MSQSIMCAVCNEFYRNRDIVYSTAVCGHLFHHHCLFRWLEESNTCPHCRHPCHRNRVHRVYLNFGERTELDDVEGGALSSKYLFWTVLEHLDRVPDGAIKCGTDHMGNDAYVARVFVSEALVPANFVPKKGVAYVPWDDETHGTTENIELLVNCDYSWVASVDGEIPVNALVTGYNEDGENLYTGRAEFEGVMLGGKVRRSDLVLYMPYKGKQVDSLDYEVLVRNVVLLGEQEEQQQESQPDH